MGDSGTSGSNSAPPHIGARMRAHDQLPRRISPRGATMSQRPFNLRHLVKRVSTTDLPSDLPRCPSAPRGSSGGGTWGGRDVGPPHPDARRENARRAGWQGGRWGPRGAGVPGGRVGRRGRATGRREGRAGRLRGRGVGPGHRGPTSGAPHGRACGEPAPHEGRPRQG